MFGRLSTTRHRAAALALALVLTVPAVLSVSGCVAPAAPQPAAIATTPPPWPAPRDAVSHIEAAGLEQLALNDTSDPKVLTLVVSVDGQAVPLAAHIGVDRVRAVQAPVHTHDQSGEVWLEGRGNRTVTLGQFFQLWGVRFDGRCLGAVCGTVTVRVDGNQVSTEPGKIVLRDVTRELAVEVNS